MQVDIHPELIELVQTGVTEPFPETLTAEAVTGWLERNRDEIHWTGLAVLEGALGIAQTKH